jgi:hypothetical protein
MQDTIARSEVPDAAWIAAHWPALLGTTAGRMCAAAE